MAGTSYTRQSTLTDGDTITASLFNAEYNQLVSAFSYAASATTGHQHDGSAGEGGNIHTIGDQDFNNKIVVDSTNNRWSVYVEVGGTAVEQVRIEDGVVYPVTDSDVDLGTNALRFKDAYIDSLTATGNLTIGGNIDVDGTIEFDGLSGTGSVTVTDILDQDDMSGDSATALATQQSIKAYVDAQVTAQDLDLTDGTTSISIDLDSEALSVLGGTGVTSTASGNGVTLAIDSTVSTLTGSQTLTNKTLTAPDVNTPDIDGGTIDGTIIGGTTAAAGSFTTVGATGNITVGGTVDGRDVAADGTKLDTVETNADVTDTANVTAAGALMDSEVTNLAQVKAFDSTDYATAAQGTTADAALPKAGGAMTGAITTNSTFDGRDVATDGTKLDGIEASADVTDTANVTAAGALMDSELTSIASVKALNQGVATTDSPQFVGITSTSNVIVGGNLTVNGTTTTLNTATLDVEDKNITINYGAGDTTGSANGAGITIQDAVDVSTDATILWDTTNDEFDFSHPINVAGTSTFAGLTTSADVSFGDNDKAIFGAGSDLQIYHDGSNSIIKDSGAGNIQLQTSGQIFIGDNAAAETFATFNNDGAVNLYHDNALKLATTSGGIQVTGHISNASGDLTLDVAGNINLDADGGEFRFKDAGTLYATAYQGGGGSFYLASAVQDKDLIFQGNDGGSTITALTLDMSAAGAATFNAGATFNGTATMDGLTVSGAQNSKVAYFDDSSEAGHRQLQFTSSNNGQHWDINSQGTSGGLGGVLTLSTRGSERLTIDTSGNVGIGDTSPNVKLDVYQSTAGTGAVDFRHVNGNRILINPSYNYHDAYNHIFRGLNGTSTHMTIDNSGRVGIGTSSPQSIVHIDQGASGDAQLTLEAHAAGDSKIVFSQGQTAGNWAVGYDDGGGATENSLSFAYKADGYPSLSGQNKMILTPTGNVGINSASPAATLHTVANAGTTGFLLTGAASNNIASFYTSGGSQAMTLDASGRLGLGVTPEAWSSIFKVLRVGTGSSIAGESGGTSTWFNTNAYYDGSWKRINTNTAAQIAHTSDGKQEFKVAASGSAGSAISWNTAMTVDNSGNLLVGTTATTINTSSSVSGHNLFSSGYTVHSRSGQTVMSLNRLSTDGTIVDFRKNGTAVGSIGTNVGRLSIGSGDTGVLFAGDIDAIYPANGIAARDSAIDLGVSGARFKDLYLSGTAKSQGVELEDIKAKDTSGINLQTSNGQKRVILDNSGNLLVGKTAASIGTVGCELRNDGYILGVNDGDAPLFLNRLSSDGDIAKFYKDGTAVGSIGSRLGAGIIIDSIGSADGLLKNNGAESYGWASSYFYPRIDNSKDLGLSVLRWDDVYATNGTINTSDRNEKQDITELSDAEQRVAVAAKGLLRKFRWKDSVAEKGDEARTHFGIIAQDLQAAFAAEGLDAGDYAMFISSTWTDEETNEEKTRMGVRYSELLAFIIAAI